MFCKYKNVVKNFGKTAKIGMTNLIFIRYLSNFWFRF